MGTKAFPEGTGFHEHRHNYEHPLTVLKGKFMVKTGGITRVLNEGDTVTHVTGTKLSGVAVGGEAIIKTVHPNERR